MGLKKIHTIRFHDANDERITEALKPDGLLAGLRKLRAAGVQSYEHTHTHANARARTHTCCLSRLHAGEIDAVSLGMCVREQDPQSAELVLRLIREAPAGTFDR